MQQQQFLLSSLSLTWERVFPQANPFSLSCSATRCCCTKPGLPVSPLAPPTSVGHAAGQRHPATGGSVFTANVSMSSSDIRSTACENTNKASHVPLSQKQQEILSDDPMQRPQALTDLVQSWGLFPCRCCPGVFINSLRGCGERRSGGEGRKLHCALYLF